MALHDSAVMVRGVSGCPQLGPHDAETRHSLSSNKQTEKTSSVVSEIQRINSFPIDYELNGILLWFIIKKKIVTTIIFLSI